MGTLQFAFRMRMLMQTGALFSFQYPHVSINAHHRLEKEKEKETYSAKEISPPYLFCPCDNILRLLNTSRQRSMIYRDIA